MTSIKAARTAGGYCLRIEGHGTMQHSPAVAAFACEALGREGLSLVLDLIACDYLDSTFLGCTIMLHRRLGNERFSVAAPPERVHQLLGPTRVDRIIASCPTAPAIVGPWIDLPHAATDPASLSRHILECHRKLAEIDGPQRELFARIADHIERDLPR